MTSLLAPALKAANVSAISAWPAGAVIVALINFIVIAFVVFLIERGIEAMKRGERTISAPDPQAQLAAAATRLAEASASPALRASPHSENPYGPWRYQAPGPCGLLVGNDGNS